LACSDDLKTLISAIPPWAYSGQPPSLNPPGGVTGVTPQQVHFYERLTDPDLGPNGPALLYKFRVMQFGYPPGNPGNPSLVVFTPLTDKITQQQSILNLFKNHTDSQSGVGDPTTFQQNIGIANAFDSAKQQMEGTNQDNFTRFFNSTIQGPVIVDQMKNLLCTPDSIGQMLRSVLDLIAGTSSFTFDHIINLLGGMTIDEFFTTLDGIFSDIAGLFDYVNYIISLDLSQFSFAQAYVQKFTLGQFLASMANGEGRGNCIVRAMLEEFTGSDNLRDAITAINIETGKEERAAEAASEAETEFEKQKAYDSQTKEKEIFFKPVDDDLIMRGIVTGTPTPTPPPIDAATIASIINTINTINSRITTLGNQVQTFLDHMDSNTSSLDGGYFDENFDGGSDGVVLKDSIWSVSQTPTPTPTPTPSPSASPRPRLPPMMRLLLPQPLPLRMVLPPTPNPSPPTSPSEVDGTR
jgi:hypothetical protein